MKLKLWLLALLLSGILPASGQVLEAWRQYYDGGRNDGATALVLDADGNVCVTGFSVNPATNGNDFITARYSPAGELLWMRRYDGPGHSSDTPGAIAVNPFGEIWVTGATSLSTNGGFPTDDSFATIKYGGEGNELWVRYLKGSTGTHPTAIALDRSDNAYVAGTPRGPDDN